ncbi:MAG: pyridoxal phosphate-dependent aminotransferase [Nannocystaceae bacterium]
MRYRRMPIEVESPEEVGYGSIRHNLAESSMRDRTLAELGLDLDLSHLLLCYGDHRGHPGLRALLGADAGLGADAALLTCGAAGALFMISTSLLGPGDHLVVVRPNYATNLETPRAIGCGISFVDLSFESGWYCDPEAIAAAIRPETRLVSITTPHNPTGVVMPWADLRALAELCERRGCWLLVDETYRDLTHGEPPPPAVTLGPRVLGVASLSKAYGLPGLRLGWVMTQDPGLRTTLLAAKEQIQITGPILEEEIAYQVLARRPALLPAIRGEVAAAFVAVKSWMDRQERFEWVPPAGGVVGFPRLREGVDVERFYRLLAEEHGTMVGPGHWFERERRSMRIGFGWPTAAELQGGLESLRAAAEAAAGRRGS